MNSQNECEKFSIKHEEDYVSFTEIKPELTTIKSEIKTRTEECNNFSTLVKTMPEMMPEDKDDMYKWKPDDAVSRSQNYWENKFGQSTEVYHNFLEQWHMPTSVDSYNNQTEGDSKNERKPVGRPKQRLKNVKYHECPLCGKSVQGLSLHMRRHTGDRPYQCLQCGQHFTQLGSLKKHQTLHSEEMFRCNICGKCFRCKSDLSQHSKLHTGKSFDCPFCSKSFVSQNAIDNHIRIHTGEKPYLCHYCGMKFSQEGNLSLHVKIHTGEKPFQCSICNKSFSTRIHLERHSRTHTGEKPYSCATCQKSFSDRGIFTRHLVVHSGEKSHICTTCNKAFTQSISLKRHSRIHTGEKPFECAICKKAFSLKRDLKRHTEKIHLIHEK